MTYFLTHRLANAQTRLNRAMAVMRSAAVESVPGNDYGAACDAIQERVVPLKRLVGATALVIATLIVIS